MTMLDPNRYAGPADAAILSSDFAGSFSFPSLRSAKIEIEEGDSMSIDVMTSFFLAALATVRKLELDYDVGSGIAVALQACLLLERLNLHIWRYNDNAVEILGILAAPVNHTIADVLVSSASAPVALTKIKIPLTTRLRSSQEVDHTALQRRLDSLLA